ncbi:MAG: hypothetical protein WBY94_05670 [Polyangiaceae bacterium]
MHISIGYAQTSVPHAVPLAVQSMSFTQLVACAEAAQRDEALKAEAQTTTNARNSMADLLTFARLSADGDDLGPRHCIVFWRLYQGYQVRLGTSFGSAPFDLPDGWPQVPARSEPDHRHAPAARAMLRG